MFFFLSNSLDNRNDFRKFISIPSAIFISVFLVSNITHAEDTSLENGNQYESTIGVNGLLPDGRNPLISANKLANTCGIDIADLQILNESTIQLEYLDEIVTRYKLRSLLDGHNETVAFDANGTSINLKDYKEKDHKIKYELYGNMLPSFYRELETKQQSEWRKVLVKMAVPDKLLDKTKDKKSLKAEAKEKNEKVESDAKQFFKNMVDELSLETIPDDPEVDGPFVILDVSSTEALKLARGKKVAFIGPMDGEVVKDTTGSYEYVDLDDALDVTGVSVLQDFLSLSGNGVGIVVIEPNRPDWSQWPKACYNIAAERTGATISSTHYRRSIAMIGNNDSNFDGTCGETAIGYAPDADIYVSTIGNINSSANYPAAYQWARNNHDIDIVSMSFHMGDEETSGDLHARDIYFDYWTTQFPYPAVFTSAGNDADDDAYASGKGYNFMGVGNMALDTTLYDRCNDDIYDESSWINPTYSDREIPEIATPGEKHNVFDVDFGGTSAATPATAGIAAILMDSNSGLFMWPEAIRAILLASASYQDGDGAIWRSWSDGRDGTGMTNAFYAYYAAIQEVNNTTPYNYGHSKGSMYYSDFDNNDYFVKTWKVQNVGVGSIRVAFTWNSKTINENSSVLDADLDLEIFNSSGTLKASSYSYDSSYEFIEYTPTSGDRDLTIKINAWDVPSDFSSYYSVAWIVNSDCL